MSHTTSINMVPITDIGALRMAVERLRTQRGVDCTLVENSKPRMYYRQQEVQCDYVLRLNKSTYDVGFQKNKDGAYVPIFDEWNGHVAGELAVSACPMPGTPEERQLRQIGMFSQEYARCTSVNAASASGYYLESETLDEKGEYQLIFQS